MAGVDVLFTDESVLEMRFLKVLQDCALNKKFDNEGEYNL
jgi:hypothetical protein